VLDITRVREVYRCIAFDDPGGRSSSRILSVEFFLGFRSFLLLLVVSFFLGLLAAKGCGFSCFLLFVLRLLDASQQFSVLLWDK